MDGEKMRRAEAMRQLLENPDVQAAFDSLAGTYTAQWRTSKSADAEARDDAWRMIRALDELRAGLRSVADAAKIETHNAKLKLRN